MNKDVFLHHGLVLNGVREGSGQRGLGAQSGWWESKVFKGHDDVTNHHSHTNITLVIEMAIFIISDSGINELPSQVRIMRGPEAHGKWSWNNKSKKYHSSWV